MPNNEEHTKHCRELYGYGFEKIHKWMDETSKARGPDHRIDRHNIDKTPEKAYELFKNKVPKEYKEYIKDAVKSHISLDESNYGKKEIGAKDYAKASQRQKVRIIGLNEVNLEERENLKQEIEEGENKYDVSKTLNILYEVIKEVDDAFNFECIGNAIKYLEKAQKNRFKDMEQSYRLIKEAEQSLRRLKLENKDMLELVETPSLFRVRKQEEISEKMYEVMPTLLAMTCIHLDEEGGCTRYEIGEFVVLAMKHLLKEQGIELGAIKPTSLERLEELSNGFLKILKKRRVLEVVEREEKPNLYMTKEIDG